MAKFCGKCGAELNKQGMCPVCDSAPVKPEGKDGQPAKKKERFCGKCGGPLNLQTGRCPRCDGSEETAGGATPPKKQHHTALLIGTIAAVLLAVAAVVGVLVHFGVLNIPAVAKLEENLGITPRPSADNTAVTDQPVEENLVTRMDAYDAGDALIWYQTYTYDDMGQRSSVTSYDSAGNQTGYVDLSTGDSYWYASCTGEVGTRHCTTVREGDTQTVTFENGYHEVTVYDADGRESMIYRYAADADDYYEYAVYEYDADGQLMKINDYLADGSLCAYTAYEYNEMGQRVRYETYDGKGRTVSSTTASYNEAGDIARSDYFTSNGQLEYYCLYEYTVTGAAS